MPKFFRLCSQTLKLGSEKVAAFISVIAGSTGLLLKMDVEGEKRTGCMLKMLLFILFRGGGKGTGEIFS